MRNSYDIFLVLQQFRQNASDHLATLGRFDQSLGEHLVGAEGYCDPSTDAALLVLRFSEPSLVVLGARALQDAAAETGLPMVVPALLTEERRRSFYREHLSRYQVYLQQYPAADEVYSLIARTLMGLSAHSDELTCNEVAEVDILSELPTARRSQRRHPRLESVL